MITNLQLAGLMGQAVREGYGYVWGKNGELYTPEEAQRLTKAGAGVPDGRDKATYWLKDCARWYGKVVADCSGGIVWAVRQYDPGFADHGSGGFAQKFTQSGPVTSIPEIPGLAVWRSGHIGIYAGGGLMHEFRGTAYGAVTTKVGERGMTLWGKLHCVDYTSAVTAAPEYPRQMAVATARDPLNLRDAPVDGAVIAAMPKGAAVWALGSADVGDGDWLEVVWYDGKQYRQGWAFAGYLV